MPTLQLVSKGAVNVNSNILERESESVKTLVRDEDSNELLLVKNTIVLPPVFQLSEGSLKYQRTKRFLDILLSSIGIVCLLPLFIIVAFLIKAEDRKSSIFFKQVRVGKNGNLFTMLKFRSMVNNAEVLLEELIHRNEVQGAMFKMKHDPRITKIGRFIRKTSIDELPQLFNVLKGEMSLVGPRPPLLREVELYSDYHKQRLCVIPGCTGLWQATVRNSVGFEEMVKLDLKYIQKKSIKYDLKIILMTIRSLLTSRAF